MLRLLRIQNLAVIETAEVEFGPGLNVLTGETGAGKSMLVDAVGLLLGARATTDIVRTGESQATVEAVFDSPGAPDLVVRREITSHGRSRAYLNGNLGTVAAVRQAVTELIELHGQHEHQALLDPLTHLALVDQFAALDDLPHVVAVAWQRSRTLRERLRVHQMDARERAARVELIDFQLGEIERVGPKPGEDHALEDERRVLASAERIRELSESAYAALYENEDAVLAQLSTIWRQAEELAHIDSSFDAHLAARESVKSELEDLAHALQIRTEGLDAGPERLEKVNQRLSALDSLTRKYGTSVDDVVTRATALAAERAILGESGETTERLQETIDAADRDYLESARKLSAARRAAAKPLAKGLTELLGGLAMDARLEVRFGDGEPTPEDWRVSGIDTAEIFLSPNPGEELRPLARIASGGELSRIMLALKTLGAGGVGTHVDGPASRRTLVFDEVDAGIGGRVAGIVGGHLRALSDAHQVLCITHLPQIAAHGTSHFLIEKSVHAGRTVTSVESLDEARRVAEIARMIGGGNVTDAVRASAADLLAAGEAKGNIRRKRKSKAGRP